MTRFRNTITWTIVSPEFFIILLAVLIFLSNPNWLIDISTSLSSSPEGLKHVAFIPIGIFIWCIRVSKNILFPPEDLRGDVQKWPKFNNLKDRVLIGIFYQFLFAISSGFVWLTVPKLDNDWSLAVLGTSIIGSVLGAITFYLASFNVVEIIKRHTTNLH